MKSLALAVVVLGLALPAGAQTRFDGEYFDGIRACGSAQSVRIQGDRARLFGECRLTNPTNLRGLQAQAFDLECPGEGGRTVSERVVLSLGSEGDLLVVRNAGWAGYPRCR